MQKLITWHLLLAFTATILLQDVSVANAAYSEAQGGAKYSLAVLELEGSGRVSSADASDLSERLREELLRAGVFQVIDKSVLKNVLASRGLHMGGCSAKACAIQIGRAAGAKLVTVGTLSKVGELYFVQVQLIHVKSGEVVESVREDFDGDFEALRSHMGSIARKLSGQSSTPSPNPSVPPSSVAHPDEMQQAPALEDSNAGSTNEDTFDFQKPSDTMKTSKSGGNIALVIGLVAIAAVGGGFLISEALKKDNDGNGGTTPPPANRKLLDPPTFP